MGSCAVRVALMLFPISMLSPCAEAIPITGSFTGIVENSRINAEDPVNAGNIDGERGSGTFYFETDASPTSLTFPPNGAFYLGMPVALTFSVHGLSLNFPNSPVSSLSLVDHGFDQLFTASAGDGAILGSNISLTGSNLFSNLDPSTFNPGAVDISNSRANFFVGRSFGGSIRLDGLQFDNSPNSVPEPDAWVLLTSGLAWIALTTRRRRMNPAR